MHCVYDLSHFSSQTSLKLQRLITQYNKLNHGAFCVDESLNIIKKTIKIDAFQFILGLFHKFMNQFQDWKQIEVQSHLSLSSKSFV